MKTNMKKLKPIPINIHKKICEKPMKKKETEGVKRKNLNEYHHMINNCDSGSNNHIAIEWFFDLRKEQLIDNYKPSKYQCHKNTIPRPPSFYDKDYMKMMTRRENTKEQDRMQEKNKENLNWDNIKHLDSARNNSFNFSTHLREFKAKERFVNPREWVKPHKMSKNASATASSFFLPSMRKRNKTARDSQIDGLTLRPYEIVYDESYVGDNIIKRKKLRKNKAIALNWYGDHLSLNPYDDKYCDANIQNDQQLMNNSRNHQTNSQLLFALQLRSYKMNDDWMLKRKLKKKRNKSQNDIYD